MTDQSTADEGESHAAFLRDIESRFFEGSLDTLDSFSTRKRVAAHPIRIGILSVLLDAETVTNAILIETTGLSADALEGHLSELCEYNLIGSVPHPSGVADARTYHRLTALGRSELYKK